MTQYDTTLAAATKAPVYLVHFVAPNRKFMSRDWPGRTSVHVGLGLDMRGSYAIDIDPSESAFRQGDLSFSIVDEDGAISLFVEQNEGLLSDRLVEIYSGFTDTPEADFKKVSAFLRDYRATDGGYGEGDSAAYTFEVTDMFGLTSRSVLQSLDNTSDFELLANITAATTSIQVVGDATVWPAAGQFLLHNGATKANEVVAYTGLTFASGTTTFTGLTRRVENTGFASKTWPTTDCRIRRCVVIAGHPLDIMRRMLTTTAGGGNGTYDAADGNGLGDIIPDSVINHTEIDTYRKLYAPVNSGWYFIFVQTRQITNVKRFIEQECLLAAGFSPTLDANGKLTVVPHYQFPPTSSSVGGRFVPDAPLTWERNLESKENDIVISYDHNDGAGEFARSQSMSQSTAVTDYLRGKTRVIESHGARGAAGVQFGYPDKGADQAMKVVGSLFLIEFARPSPTFRLRSFMSEKDRVPGTGVLLTHPGVRQVGKETRGTDPEALFLLTKKSLDFDDGDVSLSLRQRLSPFDRPFFVNQNGLPDYASASEAQKLRAYISPAGGGNFSDGKPPYMFLSSPANANGSLVSSLAFPWDSGNRNADSPGFCDFLQGVARERDRHNASKGYVWDPALLTTASTVPVVLFQRDFYVPLDCDTIELYIFLRQVYATAEKAACYLQIVAGAASPIIQSGGQTAYKLLAVSGTAVKGTRIRLQLLAYLVAIAPRPTFTLAEAGIFTIEFKHVAVE